MKKLNVDKCPLCSGSEKRVLRVSGAAGFESALVQCMKCRLKYLNRVYPPERLYAEHTVTRDDLLGAMRPEERRHDDYLREIKRGSLLEVGFGDGRLLRRARQLGFDVVGNEISDSRAARQLRREGIPVIIGDVRKARFTRVFDVIFLSHVIEHLHDVSSYLKTFHGLLRPKGRLVLLTPNYNNLFRFLLPLQDDPYRKFVNKRGVVHVSPKKNDADSLQWFKTLEFGHTFQFEWQTLKRLVERHGFALVREARGRGPDLGKGSGKGLRGLVKAVVFNEVTDIFLKYFDNFLLKPLHLQYELFMIFEKR